MTRYSLLVSLHVASVIVWLGSGTTLALVTVYARRARLCASRIDARLVPGVFLIPPHEPSASPRPSARHRLYRCQAAHHPTSKLQDSYPGA